MKKLEDELTEKMHSEFTIDAETEIKHRAGTVWSLIGFDASKEELEHWSEVYQVSVADCKRYKRYWKNLHDNSKYLMEKGK